MLYEKGWKILSDELKISGWRAFKSGFQTQNALSDSTKKFYRWWSGFWARTNPPRWNQLHLYSGFAARYLRTRKQSWLKWAGARPSETASGFKYARRRNSIVQQARIDWRVYQLLHAKCRIRLKFLGRKKGNTAREIRSGEALKNSVFDLIVGEYLYSA